MKKTTKILLSLLMMFAMISCNEDYLETYPKDAMDTGAVFTDTEGAWGAINGIHRLLYIRYQSDQDSYGQSAIMMIMDLAGEDCYMAASTNRYMTVCRWTAFESDENRAVIFAWQYFYKIIANANLIIGNIDKATGPQTDKNAIKGQALTYRAWAHFMLAQLYGMRYEAGKTNTQLGVPIMTYESPEAKARNTVEEVYTQVNNDLDEAIQLLAGYKRVNKSHLDQSVAYGIKARVALAQGKWMDAATNADNALKGYSFMSHDQQLEGYNNYDNPEWMWGSKLQADQMGNAFDNFFAYMGYNFNSRGVKEGPRCINKLLYDKISDTDVRKTTLWKKDGKTDPTAVFPEGGLKADYVHQKFMSPTSASAAGACIPYMRVAEMYLMAAEGYARTGTNDDLARTRLYALQSTRDPKYKKSTATGDALIEEIMYARRIELWGEGFRFLDLKRLKQALDRNGTGVSTTVASVMTVETGDSRWQWQIPLVEIRANSLIEQNP